MARVLCVHGVGQQLKGENMLEAEWTPALLDGIQIAGGSLSRHDVAYGFYGDLFRLAGRSMHIGDPLLSAEDLDPFEAALLDAWWARAASVDPHVPAPNARTLVAGYRPVKAALWALSQCRFFAGIAERALLGDLRQVNRYLNEPGVREQALARLLEKVTPDTRVLIGHSLGSVLAYELLVTRPELPVTALITLGSPLGVPHLVFDRLVQADTSAQTSSTERWPGGVHSWTNLVDAGDVVALVEDLRPLFGPEVAGYRVDNGSHAHDAAAYLTTIETGRAILAGLAYSAQVDR